MASVIDILGSAVKSFQPTNSVLAGGAAAVLTYAVGDILVAAGFVIPVLNIPLTIGMVATAAIPIGHLVTAIFPDSVNQHLQALATKLGTTVESIKSFIPQFEYTYPGDKPESTTVSNINQG